MKYLALILCYACIQGMARSILEGYRLADGESLADKLRAYRCDSIWTLLWHGVFAFTFLVLSILAAGLTFRFLGI